MNLTCIFFGVAFIILGIWFAFFKGYENIRAWKSMSADEKAKIKIAPLCRNIGEVVALCGIIFLLKGIWEVEWFIYAVIAWFIIAGLDVWYISKSKRYKK